MVSGLGLGLRVKGSGSGLGFGRVRIYLVPSSKLVSVSSFFLRGFRGCGVSAGSARGLSFVGLAAQGSVSVLELRRSRVEVSFKGRAVFDFLVHDSVLSLAGRRLVLFRHGAGQKRVLSVGEGGGGGAGVVAEFCPTEGL